MDIFGDEAQERSLLSQEVPGGISISLPHRFYSVEKDEYHRIVMMLRWSPSLDRAIDLSWEATDQGILREFKKLIEC